MLPLRDDNPHFLTPYVTYAIIGLNVLAWIFLQGLGGEPALAASICQLGLTPGELLNTLPAGTQVQIGPQTYCQLSASSSAHTPLTSMFMHGGWMHLLGARHRNGRRCCGEIGRRTGNAIP